MFLWTSLVGLSERFVSGRGKVREDLGAIGVDLPAFSDCEI